LRKPNEAALLNGDAKPPVRVSLLREKSVVGTPVLGKSRSRAREGPREELKNDIGS
jgi:hypothetical protein